MYFPQLQSPDGRNKPMFDGFVSFPPDATSRVKNPPFLKVPWGFFHLAFELVHFPFEAVTEFPPRICLALRFGGWD